MDTLKKLHDDEEGLTTLEVVMIIAVAAIILALIRVFWGQISAWATGRVNSATNDAAWNPGGQGN